MTYAEKRQILDMQRQLALLERRIADQAALLDRLVRRKAGRPSSGEVQEMNTLLERVNAAPH